MPPVPDVPGLAPVPYAYIATVAPSSTLVFCAGACPLTPTGEVGGTGLVEQTDLALQNLEAALAACGAVLADVVQVRIYVATADRAEVVAVWDRLAASFGDPAPPSTLLGVSVLGYPGQLVELEALAAVAPR